VLVFSPFFPPSAELCGGRARPSFGGRARTAQRTGPRSPEKESGLAAMTVCRPSDRRGSGSDPKPQCAFKVSMFNVSCNSH
jgi:hypothetical protein